MNCGDVMTPAPTCCMTQHTVVEAAELMKREDVGLIPVVSEDGRQLLGVVTDRDIAIKVVAAGLDPKNTVVTEVMTTDPVTCLQHESVESAMELMASRQVRRIPILDREGTIVGIISQADVATRAGSSEATGQVVQAISEPESVSQGG